MDPKRVFDAEGLLDTIEQSRDKLLLPPGDPAGEYFDFILDRSMSRQIAGDSHSQMQTERIVALTEQAETLQREIRVATERSEKLAQHGSYQLIPVDEQPYLPSGEILLHRGVVKSSDFRRLHIDCNSFSVQQHVWWKRHIATQSYILSDSVRSFNSIHDRVKRCETSHLLHETWMSDDIAEENGLQIETDNAAQRLWYEFQQSFTLVRYIAERKFGPHFITYRTPVNNVRITTFFAGESEAKIIQPNRCKIEEAVGCKVREQAW